LLRIAVVTRRVSLWLARLVGDEYIGPRMWTRAFIAFGVVITFAVTVALGGGVLFAFLLTWVVVGVSLLVGPVFDAAYEWSEREVAREQ
jgi:thiol:disulfide interchange protein